MKRRTPAPANRTSNTAEKRWIALAYDDAAGIDRDIEALLNSVQQAQGMSRLRASIELVRRLSLGAHQH